MENFNANQSFLTEPVGDVNPFPLDPIWPDGTRRSQPESFASPSPFPDQLPVGIPIGAGDDLFPGQIQEAIAPHIDPPSPPSPALADPLVGNSPVVNIEAIASLGRPGNGVKAEYFANADFTNRVLTRIEPKIDFDWGDGSPDEAIAKDNFSGRWTGKLQPDFEEVYTFSIRSDDAVRLWLDGEPVIDNTSDPGATITGAIALEAGSLHDFMFEYAHNSGDAAIELFWSSESQPRQIIPTSALYTPETRLPSEPESPPEQLQFLTNMFYNPGETVRFRGKAFASNSNLDEVDFWLQKDGGDWVDISDATEFVPDRHHPGYAFFDYELPGLQPGKYQLRGTAIASDLTSFNVTQSFTVLDLPEETALSDSAQQAIARAANLDNYAPSDLARTKQWTVNLRPGTSSGELATVVGARDLGATGHIPNNYIWEFPADMDAVEVQILLSELAAVQFSYPQVPVKLSSLFVPNDPLFDRQWHLDNTGQTGGEPGVDANVTNAWDEATGNGVVIGIVDDGLQHTHPDLSENYNADLSWDFNEGDIGARNYDRDPLPLSEGLTLEANLEIPLAIDGDIPPMFVDLDGVVDDLKLTLNSDHPAPEELSVYLLKSSSETSKTKYELIPGDADYEYILDGELPDDESSFGKWKLIIEDDSGETAFLDAWQLTLDVWYSHGTAVAGVAGARGNNNLGVTGVAPDADLAGLRLTAAERVLPFQIADALNWELNQEIDIYNNSWKPQRFWSDPEVLDALEDGVTSGRDGLGNVYLFGAGNDAETGENVNFNALASSRYTIAVGAIDDLGEKSTYSQEGASLLVSAPSNNRWVGITTTDLVGDEGRNVNGYGEYRFNYPDLDYTNDFGGTSSATPVVSGVVALMLEVNPDLTWRDVQHILVETADREKIPSASTWSGDETDEIRHSHRFGFGVVDADAAVNAAASWTPVPAEVSISTGVLDVGRDIPDGDGKGITDAITIESDITVESVEVVFDADHELRSDLKIELTSPSGTTSVLAFPWFEFSESDAGYDNWMLTSVRHWGESSLGEWQLQVVDDDSYFSDEAGTWNFWELKIHGTKPTVSIEATGANASEDGDTGEFTFTRTGNTDHPLILNYSESGTAAGGDYEALTGIVEIPAGSDSATVSIVPIDDDEVEGDETVFVVIDADDAYDIGTNNSATVTIADNDNNPPTLTQIELLTGAKEETSFTISYSELMAKSDAADADGDPIAFEISTIASGRLRKNDVPVEPGVTTLSDGEAVVWTPDTVGDQVAAFAVRAFDGTDYSAQVQVNVAVAALPVVTISATDANASEDGDSGEFAVTRSGATTESLSVSYSTAGDATAGSDYSTIGEIVFPAGSSEVTVSLDPIDDEEIEGHETVVLNLEAGTGYLLGEDRSVEVRIADNDEAIDLLGLTLFSTKGLNLTPGDDLNVRFFLENIERGEAGAFNVAFYLSSDDIISTGDRNLGNYEISQLEGNTRTENLFVNLTLPDRRDIFWNGDGSYRLGMIIDSEGAISESNENNNANTGHFQDYIDINITGTQENQLPVVTDDAVTVTQESTATIAILTNDSDPDGDALTITGVSTAASGEVVIGDNQIIYTPDSEFAGTDSIIYTVSDGHGGTDTGVVTVRVLRSQYLPNDPMFEAQWYLNNTGQTGGNAGVDANVTEAWKYATGKGIVIGIVDDGLQYEHPDIQGNYRPDLSRDFNEGDIETRNYDRDPAPYSEGLIFDVNMENPVSLTPGSTEIPSRYVQYLGTVETLKVSLDIEHPSPNELDVYLSSPNGTELELVRGEKSNEYTIAPEALKNEQIEGEWQLIIYNNGEKSGVLNNWWLTLDAWNSHGTSVAGIAAASGNNNLGITGVAPEASLAGLRLLAAERVQAIKIADALYSELNQEIDIYNNSWKAPVFWAGRESMSALQSGVTRGRDGLGNIYVFGAGNNASSGENVNYNALASSRYTIAVGAIDHTGKKSTYSQQGASLLISAPSSNRVVGMTTTDLLGGEGRNFNGDGEYGPNYPDLDYTNDFGGTDAASSIVSGVAALMLETNPSLTWRDVQHILVETANRDLIADRGAKWTGSEVNEIRHSHRYGFGVVDAEAAVKAAASWTPVAPEVSIASGTLRVDEQIPDNNEDGVTHKINITEDINLEWVEVVMDVTHELRSDLQIKLISPEGTTSVLAFSWLEFPESNAGYDNWVFSSVAHWGESSVGEWQLQVVDTWDDLNNSAGTWNSVELKLYGTPTTNVDR